MASPLINLFFIGEMSLAPNNFILQSENSYFDQKQVLALL